MGYQKGKSRIVEIDNNKNLKQEVDNLSAQLAQNTNEVEVLNLKTDYVQVVSDFNADSSGEVSSSQAFKNAILSALNKSSRGVHKEIILPKGVFVLEDKALSDIIYEGSIKRGLTFKGAGPYSTILLLKTNGQPSWFYNNGENNPIFERVTFRDIGFCTDNATYGNGFKIWSAGGEKQFRFFNCAFGSPVYSAAFDGSSVSMNQLFQFDGTGNADAMKFHSCYLNSEGDMFTFNNQQSVCTELYGTDVNTSGNFINVLTGGGGSFHQYGGSFVMMSKNGETESKYILKVADDAKLDHGNGDYSFYGVRYEMRNELKKIVKATGGSYMVKALFDGCQWGTVHGGNREVVEINARKTVEFKSCILNRNFYFRIKGTTSGEVSAAHGGLILFNNCDTGGVDYPLFKRITMEENLGRAIATNSTQRGSKAISQMSVLDFDLGWKNSSPREPSVVTKLISFKPQWRPFPTPDGSNEPVIEIPKNTVIKTIYINRPSGSSSGTYKLHVGSDDKSVIYASSTQTQENENHIIKLENAFIDTGEVEKLRLWATGDINGSRTGGFAFIEYY